MDIKLGAIVLDSADPDSHADFYAAFLGWKKHPPEGEWVIVASEAGEGTPLVFQPSEGYIPPTWPPQPGKQQQMTHLDFYVDEVAPAVQHALACGAVLAEVQFDPAWRVMLDPAGHPFCILPNKAP